MSVVIDTELFPAKQQYLRVIGNASFQTAFDAQCWFGCFSQKQVVMNFEVKSVGLQIIPVHYPSPLPPPKKKTLAVWLPVKFLLF